jgi:cytidyltransferase-like protein
MIVAELKLRVYTGGTFDIPHLGHYNFFKQIKELWPECWLVVSLNTDKFIGDFKGKKPLFSYDERRMLLNKVSYIDSIITNTGGADSKPAIISTQPNVIAIGNDWLEKDYCGQMGFDAQ